MLRILSMLSSLTLTNPQDTIIISIGQMRKAKPRETTELAQSLFRIIDVRVGHVPEAWAFKHSSQLPQHSLSSHDC